MATVSAISVNSISIISMPLSAELTSLVARAKAGDGSACQALFNVHAKHVYSLSLRLAGAELEAEDLTRDIFLAAFANLNAIPDDDAFAAEIYRQSARTLTATYFRRRVNETSGQHLNLNQHLNNSGQKICPPEE
jgi:DNA-directed RNA polymerase specialized sigma24 family protein